MILEQNPQLVRLEDSEVRRTIAQVIEFQFIQSHLNSEGKDTSKNSTDNTKIFEGEQEKGHIKNTVPLVLSQPLDELVPQFSNYSAWVTPPLPVHTKIMDWLPQKEVALGFLEQGCAELKSDAVTRSEMEYEKAVMRLIEKTDKRKEGGYADFLKDQEDLHLASTRLMQSYEKKFRHDSAKAKRYRDAVSCAGAFMVLYAQMEDFKANTPKQKDRMKKELGLMLKAAYSAQQVTQSYSSRQDPQYPHFRLVSAECQLEMRQVKNDSIRDNNAMHEIYLFNRSMGELQGDCFLEVKMIKNAGWNIISLLR